MKTMFII